MMGNKDNQLTIFFKQRSTLSIVLYFVGIAEFLTNVIPLICRSFRLMMKWYSVESTVTKSVDVEMIRYGFSPPDTDSIDNTNTEIITRNNGRGFIIEEWEKVRRLLLLTHFYNFIIYNILFHVFYLLFFFFHLKSCNFIIIIN